jgi:precorrin-2/cobalt-factor-2 C20-methyltransferase
MKGIAYCVGVGPGDPKLLTLRAAELIRNTRVIALPGSDPKATVAYRIAAAAIPEIADKELVGVDMPMTRDPERLAAAHRNGAALIESYLDRGQDVVFLTLGDPGIYCTFSYLQAHLEADGYPVELVPGIPSFCAAAARLGIPLTEWDEPLHVLPGAYLEQDLQALSGTCVIMKSASRMKDVKAMLKDSGRTVQAVVNCGMEGEKLFHSLDEIPDDAGYFALLIAKDK